MFGLFKRSKAYDWEIELLKRITTEISENELLNQLDDNLLRGVITNVSDIEGYVAFTYNYNVVNKYEDPKANAFRITNIKVYDKKSLSYLDCTIYVSRSMINGYSIQGAKKFDIDLDKIKTSNYKKVIRGSDIYNIISQIFTSEEIKLINPSDIYKVHLDGKDYYHLRDIEDGDFIGFDLNKNFYKVTHDPYKIELLNNELKDIINGRVM